MARDDKRTWVVNRRERTRQSIELGGLVAKAGLIDLTDDDRAVVFGLLVECAATLRSEHRDEAVTLWRRRGKRAFADDLTVLGRSEPEMCDGKIGGEQPDGFRRTP